MLVIWVYLQLHRIYSDRNWERVVIALAITKTSSNGSIIGSSTIIRNPLIFSFIPFPLKFACGQIAGPLKIACDRSFPFETV